MELAIYDACCCTQSIKHARDRRAPVTGTDAAILMQPCPETARLKSPKASDKLTVTGPSGRMKGNIDMNKT